MVLYDNETISEEVNASILKAYQYAVNCLLSEIYIGNFDTINEICLSSGILFEMKEFIKI